MGLIQLFLLFAFRIGFSQSPSDDLLKANCEDNDNYRNNGQSCSDIFASYTERETYCFDQDIIQNCCITCTALLATYAIPIAVPNPDDDKEECVGIEGWVDSEGFSCASYISCITPGYEIMLQDNPDYYTQWADGDGISAVDACCDCGCCTDGTGLEEIEVDPCGWQSRGYYMRCNDIEATLSTDDWEFCAAEAELLGFNHISIRTDKDKCEMSSDCTDFDDNTKGFWEIFDYECVPLGEIVTTTPEPGFWIIGEWGDCSVSCGVGNQIRSVTCSTGDEADCAEEKPDEIQDCNSEPCPEPEDSEYCDWTIRGENIRCRETITAISTGKPDKCQEEAELQGASSFSIREDNNKCEVCADGSEYDENTRGLWVTYDAIFCLSGEWLVGEWGLCSVTCGEGTESRTVVCSEDDTSECPAEIPEETQICNLDECPTTAYPSFMPTQDPLTPTVGPSFMPTQDPLTPTAGPSFMPTQDPLTPTAEPSFVPTVDPTPGCGAREDPAQNARCIRECHDAAYDTDTCLPKCGSRCNDLCSCNGSHECMELPTSKWSTERCIRQCHHLNVGGCSHKCADYCTPDCTCIADSQSTSGS